MSPAILVMEWSRTTSCAENLVDDMDDAVGLFDVGDHHMRNTTHLVGERDRAHAFPGLQDASADDETLRISSDDIKAIFRHA